MRGQCITELAEKSMIQWFVWFKCIKRKPLEYQNMWKMNSKISIMKWRRRYLVQFVWMRLVQWTWTGLNVAINTAKHASNVWRRPLTSVLSAEGVYNTDKYLTLNFIYKYNFFEIVVLKIFQLSTKKNFIVPWEKLWTVLNVTLMYVHVVFLQPQTITNKYSLILNIFTCILVYCHLNCFFISVFGLQVVDTDI